MEIQQEPNRMYFTNDSGETIAEVTFPAVSESVVEIDHTFVNSACRGGGIEGTLMENVGLLLRKEQKKARLTCPYAQDWFGRHPEYRDVVADAEKGG